MNDQVSLGKSHSRGVAVYLSLSSRQALPTHPWGSEFFRRAYGRKCVCRHTHMCVNTWTHIHTHECTPHSVHFIICKPLSPSQLEWSSEESNRLLNCSIFSAQTGLLRERFKGFLISLLTESHKGKEDYMAFKFYFLTNLALLDKPFHFITFLCLPNWDNDTDLRASDRGIKEPWLINNCEIIV